MCEKFLEHHWSTITIATVKLSDKGRGRPDRRLRKPQVHHSKNRLTGPGLTATEVEKNDRKCLLRLLNSILTVALLVLLLLLLLLMLLIIMITITMTIAISITMTISITGTTHDSMAVGQVLPRASAPRPASKSRQGWISWKTLRTVTLNLRS